MNITETRRVYSRWVLDGEVTDRSWLGEEVNDFCAQYTIYHVTEEREHDTEQQTESETSMSLKPLISHKWSRRNFSLQNQKQYQVDK